MLTKKKSKPKLRSRSSLRSLALRPSSLTVPDSVRFVYQDSGESRRGSDYFVVHISTEKLQFFDHVEPNCYTPHDHHNCCDHTRFRHMDPDTYLSYLGHNPHSRSISPAVVGSHVYFLFVDVGEHMEWWSYCLDNKTPPRSLPPPLCPTRYFCTALSLQGKVYIWGGLDFHSEESELPTQTFAEVYDPETEQWSNVPQPPDVNILIRKRKRESLIIVFLGESEGKVMIYDFDTPSPKFYFYDVVSQKWTVRVPPRSLQFEPKFILHEAIINEDDGNLYWIDWQLCFVHCFDWKTMQVFSGPIVGIEHEKDYVLFNKNPSTFSLHHLWGDFFCLHWDNYINLSQSFCREHHFTFLRMVKGPDRGSLLAFVIGCFMDSCYDRSSYGNVIRI